MSPSCLWVKVNETLLDSIKSMDNSMSDDEFRILLEKLSKDSTGTQPHWKTLSFLVDRSQKFTMNSEQFYNDLVELGLSNSKAAVLQKHWTDRLKPVLSNLSLDGGDINEVSRISWNLDVEMVSSGINRTRRNKTPMGVINLLTTRSEAANLELNHADLTNFCNTIEEIQRELDTIRSL